MKHLFLKKITIVILIMTFIFIPILWKVYGDPQQIRLAVLLFFCVGCLLALAIYIWTEEAKTYSNSIVNKTFKDLLKGDSIYFTDNCKVIKELIIKNMEITKIGLNEMELEIQATTAEHTENGRNNYCFTVDGSDTKIHYEDYPYFFMVSINPKDVCNFAIHFNDTKLSIKSTVDLFKKDRLNDTIKQQYLAFKDKDVAKTKITDYER